MRRVSVVGNSGSGKSALATAVAARLGVPYVELDAIFHQPDWGELTDEEFRRRVAVVIEADGWVVDGNYAAVRDLVWDRADTVVWLDLPRRVVMRRVVARSLDRVLFRRELWNGNRERLRELMSRDPNRSIVAWAWTQHEVYRDRYSAAAADPANAHLGFIRLRTPREVDAFVASLEPRELSGPPRAPVRTPAAVEALAGTEPVRPVWENELGGLTFEVGAGARRRFVKWAPLASGIDLGAEAARLEWAAAYTPVPRVLEGGTDDAGSWLVTSPLAGENAVTDRWKADPATAVSAIGDGLRAMHDTLPVAGCPFSWSAPERIDRARRRATAGQIDPARWEPEHQGLTIEQALALIAEPPPTDKLVVCHGDACAPNTLLHEDGRWSGHVDFGALGVADRWADIAIAAWSTNWNYGPGWEATLLNAYGIEPEPEHMAYYRLLWDLGS